jgi:pilus assembly protein CpaE
MNSQALKVSILYGSGVPDPAYREILGEMDNLQILKEAGDPENFLTQHENKPPDMVLVHLDGMTAAPGWLKPLIAQMPQSEVMICSHSRDPDFLIRILELRPGGFIPLPFNRKELVAHVERVRTEKERHARPGNGKILTIVGTKGGVGTTSLATNLGVALAAGLPREVVLVDLARPFPHVGQFLDLKSPHTIKDLADSTSSLDSIFVEKVVQKHKSGLDVLLGFPNYSLEPGAFPDFPALTKTFEALRSSYQWIVVDLGGWLDVLSVGILQEVDQIFLLTELSVPHLQNLKFIMALVRDSGDDHKVKIVVNHYMKDYSLGLKDVEAICDRPVFATLPHDYLPLIEAINQGMALGEVAPRSKLWRKLKGLATELEADRTRQTEKEVAARPGLLQRLFA